MLRKIRAELSLRRVLAIFAAGVLAGIQIALYLFDLYDDGTAATSSGIIGLVLLGLGLLFIGRSFKRER